VNILRDLPADLRLGRCYLPEKRLVAENLKPPELLDPANESRFRPAYNHYLSQAEDHLAAGWGYTNALPRRSMRVRLACAWPILIGLQTLKLLRRATVLGRQTPVKISRADVKQWMLRSVVYYPWQPAWRRLADIARGEI